MATNVPYHNANVIDLNSSHYIRYVKHSKPLSPTVGGILSNALTGVLLKTPFICSRNVYKSEYTQNKTVFPALSRPTISKNTSFLLLYHLQKPDISEN